MTKKIDRRSFMSRVGATVSLGALAAVTGACDQLGLGGSEDSDEEEDDAPAEAEDSGSKSEGFGASKKKAVSAAARKAG